MYIKFGHPCIGKTTARQELGANILDFDSDYKHMLDKMINKALAKKGLVSGPTKGHAFRMWFKNEHRDVYNELILDLYRTARFTARQMQVELWVSDMVILRTYPEDFAIAIMIDAPTFYKRCKMRNDYSQSSHTWKENLDKLVTKVMPANKIVFTDKYLIDLI